MGEGAVKGVQKSLAERRGARKGERYLIVQAHLAPTVVLLITTIMSVV